jgi:flagellar biosynthetic protein FlhB
MDEAEQNRSEPPTPFKLMRARQKGSVARGTDLGFLTGLAAFLVYLWIAGPDMGAAVAEASRRVLAAGPGLAEGDGAILSVIGALFSAVLAPLAIFAAALFAVVLLFELLQTGVVFSAEPLKPDFARLNPAQGLKRLFSLRMLMETGKNVLKLAAYSAVGWLLIGGALAAIGRVTDARSLAAALGRSAFDLLAACLLVALAVAVLDQLIARRDFLRRMRMSRRELRRELRDREGEPRLKQKRKQMHGEFVKLSQSLRSLRGADVLIVNPRHVALALRYDGRRMAAPVVVSIGTDRVAQRLKRLAFLYGIAIVEDPRLARELLKTAALNRPIPEHCYQPVADIYNKLRKRPR